MAFGWGDKGFYLKTPTWADLKFSKAFKASSGLGNSAIHTTLHYQLSESNNYKRILISSKHYLNLITYIKKTLKLDNEKPILINTNANYNSYDDFYEAKGSDSLFHTCNTWSNNGLKKCGQKACLWTPLDEGIFYHYK
ncbi:MAG: DUF2459 domain-containing protein [Bacteroidetes bacterium]|nr:DUF2459 domain-containing protein [Bacteroidota bacterium]